MKVRLISKECSQRAAPGERGRLLLRGADKQTKNETGKGLKQKGKSKIAYHRR